MKKRMEIWGAVLGSIALSVLIGLVYMLAVKSFLMSSDLAAEAGQEINPEIPGETLPDETGKEESIPEQRGPESEWEEPESKQEEPESGPGQPAPEKAHEPDSRKETGLEGEGRVIYLTFDDGPGPYTERLLDILKKYEVKATFFVTGSFPEYLDLISREKDEGHTVGLHCWNHDYRTVYSGEDDYFDDLRQMDDVIFEKTGTRSELIRFPGGSSNESSLFNPGIMTRLTAMVGEKGYRYVDWNVLSGDAVETKDTKEIVRNVIDGVRKQSAAVVLQHDIYSYSVDAVEEIILWGMQNGYCFLPYSQESPEVHHTVAN